MTKNLEQAMNNIKLITGQARLTREEHKQIIADIDLIEKMLESQAACEGLAKPKKE